MNAINAPKHKAKLYNRNKWIEGNYFSRQETTYCFTEDYLRNPPKTLHYIAVDTMTDWGLPNEFRLYPIDQDTLCQSTGKTDKNGQYIFENDIVRTKYGRICVVRWHSSDSYCGFDLFPINTSENLKLKPPSEFFLWCSEDMEIMGNAIDNPELMKGKNNGTRN